MPVSIKGTGGGGVTLDAGAAASTTTLTLPNVNGTVATTTGTLTNPTINGFTGDTSVVNIGSGQIYKDSSGNVGIGTSSPTNRLDVTAATGVVNVSSSTGTNYAKLQCNNSGGSYQFGIDNSAGTNFGSGVAYARVIWNDSASAPTIFYTNSTERARIDASGSLNVGGTGASNGGAILYAERSTSAVVGRYYASQASGYTSDVLQAITNQGSSTACTIFGAYYSGGAAFAFRVRGDGTIYAQNTTVQSASDARFKENIVDSTDGLNVVTALRPVRFDIKEGHGVSEKQNQLGFIAQEVKAIFPDAVDIWKESDDPENPYLSLGTTAMIPVLVKAIQELKAQNDELKARVAALETK